MRADFAHNAFLIQLLLQAANVLQAYIDHLAKIGLADRVVAYFICAGQSTEWTKWSSSGRLACGDYSDPMRRHFRAFLRKHGIEWDERYVWD